MRARSSKGRHQREKNVFFRALPESPKPPQLGPLFSEVEIQDLKVSLELRILYVLLVVCPTQLICTWIFIC